MSSPTPPRWRPGGVTLAIVVLALVLLEWFTPCSGFIIDQAGCWLEARDEVDATFQRIIDELGDELARRDNVVP